MNKILIYVGVFLLLCTFVNSTPLPNTPERYSINKLSASHYWSLNNVVTESINGTDGTNTNCAFQATNPFGDASMCLYCDGNDNDYFETNFLGIKKGSPHTICFWIRADGAQDDLDKYFGSMNGEHFYYLQDKTAETAFYVKSGAGGATVEDNIERGVQGSWTHICLTKTGLQATTTLIYINGTSKNSVDDTDGDETDTSLSNELWFMALNTNGVDSNNMKGWLCDIVIDNSSAWSGHYINTTYQGNWTSPITVNIVYPSNSSGFNDYNLTELNHQIYINGTHNHITGTTCGINHTSWTSNGANLDMGFNFTFINNSAISTGLTDLYVHCNLSGTDNGTYALRFTIDITDPVIDPTDRLGNNQSIVYNGTLATQINFTDDLEIYSINITWQNGSVLFDRTNIGLNHFEVNITHPITNNLYINASVCDSHTKNDISAIRYDIDKAGLKYVIIDRPLWFQDDYVHIYPKNYGKYSLPTTTKLSDRYTFSFQKKGSTLNSEVFVIESNKYLDIVKSQFYGGHIVIPELGYWVDLDTEEATSYKVTRISDTKIEVEISGLKSPSIEMNSIGELNCIYEYFWFANLFPIEEVDYYVLVGDTSTFGLKINKDANIVTQLNASLFYNNTRYYLGFTHNWTQDIVAPAAVIGNTKNISFNFQIGANNYLYNLTTKYQNVSDFGLDNCSTYATRALNFTFYNTSDQKELTNIEMTIIYESNNISKNFSYTVTRYNTSLCILGENFEASIHLDYSASWSSVYSYMKNFTLNATTQLVDIYYEADTTVVTFTVFDENDNRLENAQIEIQTYDVGTGTYRTTQIIETDTDGQAFGNIVLDTVWYRFIIKYNGVVVLTTINTKITETTKDFRVILGDTPEAVVKKIYAGDIRLTSHKNQQWFNVSWSEIATFADAIYLNITTGNLTSSVSTLYHANSTLNSGYINYTLPFDLENRSVTYLATVYIISSDDGEKYYVDSETLTWMYEYEIFGDEALFMTFIFVGTLIFLGLAFGPEAALLLNILGILGFTALGFIEIAITGVMSIVVVLVILMIKVRRSGI